jgi:gliding motility-associated-like protein
MLLPFSSATRRLLPFAMLLITGRLAAQSPGGVSTGLTAWLKANTAIAGNMTVSNTSTGQISQWKSEVGTLSVSQSTTAYQPRLQSAASTIANFNFNPVVQFSTASATSIYSTATTPDLLGTGGTLFFVCNGYTGSFTNPTGLTYYSNFSYRYQVKPTFRLQVGSGSAGYTADINATGGPVNTAPDASAFILVSKSNGAGFRARKNADSIPLTNTNDPVYFPAISSGLRLGNDGMGGGGQPYNGAIAEVITYNTSLSIADINKVETYLALKYGITISQASAYGIANSSYVSSAGNVIWDATANAGYGKNITGIGQDNGSGLLQKQSRSVHNNALLFLYAAGSSGSTGFPAMNADNTATLTDQDFVIAGDNGQASALTTCGLGGRVARMPRVWKLQKTAGIAAFIAAVNTTDVPASVKNILVSADPTFPANATQVIPLQTLGGKSYASISAASNSYFTFAADPLTINLATVQPTCATPAGGTVTATVSGSVTPYAYNWQPGSQTTTTISGLSSGTYTLIVSDAAGCQYAQSATINPVVLPAAPAATATAVCAGENTTLTVSPAITGTTYAVYAAATGGTALATSSTGVFTLPVTAAVTYYAEAVSGSGCSSTRTPVAVSLLSPLPNPVVTAGTVGAYTLTFSWAAITGATGYAVSVNGGAFTTPSSGATGLSHTVTGLSTGQTASIVVRALAANSCQSSTGTATATTVTDQIFVPNAFTPNGDGRNDVLLVYGNVIQALHLQVFNQWGEKVFESYDKNTGWNGTCKGKQQPSGVYVYTVHVTTTAGQVIDKKGSLTLVR